jgi:hypothetical protein
MCGGTRWEEEGWRPFTRLAGDLLPRRPRRVKAVPASRRAQDALEQGAPACVSFRELNDQIRRLEGRWAIDELDLVCECADPHCFAPLTISLAAYDRLRADDEQFLVLPGHERQGELVAASAGYLIVRYAQPSAPTLTSGSTSARL